MLLGLIVACEIAFWVVLGAGLATRYLLGQRRLSSAMLMTLPLLDVVVLVVSALDLKRGATAETAHGLAAAYVGFSIAFGPSLVRWADERFAHRFAAAPAPRRQRRHGRERTLHEWREFGKAVLAWAVACGILLATIAFVDDASRTAALSSWLQRLTLVLVVWALWPITYTLWPSQPTLGQILELEQQRARMAERDIEATEREQRDPGERDPDECEHAEGSRR